MASASSVPFVLPFAELDANSLAQVGGKGANLGEMARAGLPVPPGFCVTTAAFSAFLDGCAEAGAQMDAIDALAPDALDPLRELGAALREALEATPIPAAIEDAIRAAFRAAGGEREAWAVRSSATLEDLPEASFAGQQDTYLGVRGIERLLERTRACWASLFTDRAISYRRQHGFASRDALLSVVVQRMVAAERSGVLFTADPLGGHRRVASIDATYGLGEALVSGRVEADNYRLARDGGALLEHRLGRKAIEIVMSEAGTETREVDEARRAARALDDAQLRELLALGERVEAHYGAPQDIEWCFAAGELYLVQTRPITTLYPIPQSFGAPDQGAHVYLCFNHIQVMTDTISPLGMDTLRWLFPVGKRREHEPSSIFRHAGGRVFMDATPAMLRPFLRRRLPELMTLVDPKMAAMLRVVVERGDYLEPAGREPAQPGPLVRRIALPVLRGLLPRLLWRDPSAYRAEAEALCEALPERWCAPFEAAEDPAAALAAGRRSFSLALLELMHQVFPAVICAMISWRLLRRLTGEDPRVEELTRGLEGNVTTQMDLELADIADLARAQPELLERLRERPPLLLDAEALASIPGGPAVSAAWSSFLARYGHRAVGEIDLGRPRWQEDPSSLVASFTGLLIGDEVGDHRRRHDQAARGAEAAAEGLIAEARGLRRWLIRRSVARMRVGLALREHPKFTIMRALWRWRRALQEIGAGLVAQGQLAAIDDLFFLHMDEIEAAIAGEDPRARVATRRAAYREFAKLRPPRVITHEGEIPRLPRNENLPPNTLEGASASLGVVEGVARVILDPTRAQLQPGEILVAPFTDPGWTPLFVPAAGLVMEVGGLMTHGSVVAREYGIPAVVGVDECTSKIQSGQRIRVDGDRGLVELL